MLNSKKIQELLRDHEYLQDVTIEADAFDQLQLDIESTRRYPSHNTKGAGVIEYMRYENKVTIRKGKRHKCRECGRENQ